MHRKLATLIWVAFVTAACNDATAPQHLSLSFCPGTSWAAYQNEGEEWRSLGQSPTTAAISASERLGIARILLQFEQGGPETVLEVSYLTREQARSTFTCQGNSGKQVSGSVDGITSGYVFLALVDRAATVLAGSLFGQAFTFSNVSEGPRDLVASYLSAKTVIVRRAVDYPAGSTIPALDFGSAEPFALQSHTLTLNTQGLVGPTGLSSIITPRGTLASLSVADSTIYTLPSNQQEAGDIYQVRVSAGGGGDVRGAERYYVTPSAQTIALGPAAKRPTFTTAVGDGVIWRADIESQPEYASQVDLVVYPPQPSSSNIAWRLRASKEYYGGTPNTWALNLPDFAGLEGFPPAWSAMVTPGGYSHLASGVPLGFSNASARDGDLYRWARAY